MRRSTALIFLLGLPVALPAFAQSAPPDLDPKLTGKPVIGTQDMNTSEKPKPRDPPRGPAVPDLSAINAPAPTPSASPAR